jgi:hypothetical protein
MEPINMIILRRREAAKTNPFHPQIKENALGTRLAKGIFKWFSGRMRMPCSLRIQYGVDFV